ncbi:MAG: hypothetical protein ABSC13_03565 [Dehalococcoidia bacterium]|jgi:hypothetical protein
MDNDYELNVAEIVQTVETAEVLTLRFVVISQRLLIDTRYTPIDGPLLKLVPSVKTAEDRFRSLKQLRPRFRIPDKICSVWWPKHIDSLASSGIWPAIARRVIDSGSPSAAQLCEDTFRELLEQEQEEVRNAILGKGYQALWECFSPDQPRKQ